MKQSITVCLTLLLIAGCQDSEGTLEAVPLAPADIEASRSARDNPQQATPAARPPGQRPQNKSATSTRPCA